MNCCSIKWIIQNSKMVYEFEHYFNRPSSYPRSRSYPSYYSTYTVWNSLSFIWNSYFTSLRKKVLKSYVFSVKIAVRGDDEDYNHTKMSLLIILFMLRTLKLIVGGLMCSFCHNHCECCPRIHVKIMSRRWFYAYFVVFIAHFRQ